MPEGTNIEIAHKLAEPPAEGQQRPSRAAELLEVAEAVVLAVVAITTAWNGYQSAKWDGRQSMLYGASARLRVEAAVAAIEGGQQRLLDVVTFNAWQEANESKHEKLAALYVNRFSPEYRVAFDAWLKSEPLTKPGAQAHPTLMPEYHNALLEKSERLNQEATATFQEGTEARAISEKYVRLLVLLATVLFLIAVAQRLKRRNVRAGLFLVATALMIYALINAVKYARL